MYLRCDIFTFCSNQNGRFPNPINPTRTESPTRLPSQVPVIEPQVSDYSVRLVCNYIIIIIILCMEEYEYASLNSLNTKK